MPGAIAPSRSHPPKYATDRNAMLRAVTPRQRTARTSRVPHWPATYTRGCSRGDVIPLRSTVQPTRRDAPLRNPRASSIP